MPSAPCTTVAANSLAAGLWATGGDDGRLNLLDGHASAVTRTYGLKKKRNA